MSLKTSFYNKSVLKSDLKRFWWVGLLETIILFLTNTLPLWYRISDQYRYSPGSGYEVGRYVTWQNLQFVIPCVFAISVVVLLFSYMHQVASVSFYHSMPVTRKKLYVTKILSSMILTIMPIVINTLIIWGICFTAEGNLAGSFIAPLIWLYTGIVYTVLFVSLSAFINMMSGTPIGTMLFSMGFIFLPLVGVTFYEYFCTNEVYGFSWDSAMDCLEWIYISEKNLLDISHLLVYVVFIMIFFLLAYLLYKKRKLEMYGEVIAFGGLKPVFIGIISVVSSMVSYAYLGEVFRDRNAFYALPIGLLGTIIAWMVSRKSISPKGILKPASLYIVISLAIIGFVKLDVSGFERRIPDVADVEWVDIIDVYNNRGNYMYIDNERIELTPKGLLDTKFYDEKEIALVIDMHRYAVENRFEGEEYRSIPIKYKLKNGKILERRYNFNYERDKEVLKPVYNTEKVRAKMYELIDGSEKNFVECQITDRRVKNGMVFYANDEILLKLVDAVKKDLLTIPYEETMLSSGGSVQLSFDYNIVIETEKEIDDDVLKNHLSRGQSVRINDKYENTMKILEEIGFLSKIPDVSEIVSCNVSVWREGVPASAMVEDVEIAYKTEAGKVGPNVTDRVEIEQLYGLYDEIITDKKFTDYNNCINVRVIYTTKDHEFEASCSYDEDKFPEILKKYM